MNGCVAVVTGGSRGAGRGIAIEPGAAGSTVYVTGRSTRAQPATTYDQILKRSELSERELRGPLLIGPDVLHHEQPPAL